MRNYISVNLPLANLLTEIRVPSLFFCGFILYELNQIYFCIVIIILYSTLRLWMAVRLTPWEIVSSDLMCTSKKATPPTLPSWCVVGVALFVISVALICMFTRVYLVLNGSPHSPILWLCIPSPMQRRLVGSFYQCRSFGSGAYHTFHYPAAACFQPLGVAWPKSSTVFRRATPTTPPSLVWLCPNKFDYISCTLK